MSRPSPEAGDLRRLRWQCRRGMLELDYLLERYLQRRYAKAPAVEQAAFCALLRLQDPQLSEWLVTDSAEPDPEFRSLVARIRQP